MGPGTLVAERVKREGKADGWKLYVVAKQPTATGVVTLVRAGGGSYMEAKTNKNFAELVEKSDDWQVVDTYAVDILVSNKLNEALAGGDSKVSRDGESDAEG